jgi:hypothetical protein
MKCVFFAPFAAIWKHSEIELQIENLLIRQKHDVEFIRCREDFDVFCITMSAYGLNFQSTRTEKKVICNNCLKAKTLLGAINGSSSKFMQDCLDSSEMVRLKSIVDNLVKEEILHLEYRGVPIGRFCAYEFFLRHKLTKLSIPDHLWPEYQQSIYYGLLTAEFGFSYFSSNKVDHVFVYNELYSLNMIFVHVANMFGVRSSSIEALGPITNIHSRFVIDNGVTNAMSFVDDAAWRLAENTPITPIAILKVLRNTIGLMRARSFWTYSVALPKRSSSNRVKDFFNISKDKQVILFTLSSQDEILAYSLAKRGFQAAYKSIDQLQIMINLIDFVKTNTEYILIIRPHPREYPNKREGKLSEFGKEIQDTLDATVIPENVRINYPDQNVSIYELASIADILVNSISSVGVEFALLGIPVGSFKNTGFSTYPKSLNSYFNSTNPTSEEMKRIIDSRGQNLQTAFRWMHFKLYEATYNSFSTNTIVSRTVLRLKRRVNLGVQVSNLFGILYKICTRVEKVLLVPVKSRKLNTRIVNEIDPDSNLESFILKVKRAPLISAEFSIRLEKFMTVVIMHYLMRRIGKA